MAYGVNQRGRIVGNTDIGNFTSRGFVYDMFAHYPHVRVRLIQPLPGARDSYAMAINDLNVVAGISDNHVVTFSATGLTDLGPLGNDGYFPSGLDINDQGVVVTDRNLRPVIFDPTKPHPALTDIPLPHPFVNGYASAINNSGDIVGQVWDASSNLAAFIYSGGAFSDLNKQIPPDSGWVLNMRTTSVTVVISWA